MVRLITKIHLQGNISVYLISSNDSHDISLRTTNVSLMVALEQNSGGHQSLGFILWGTRTTVVRHGATFPSLQPQKTHDTNVSETRCSSSPSCPPSSSPDLIFLSGLTCISMHPAAGWLPRRCSSALIGRRCGGFDVAALQTLFVFSCSELKSSLRD